MIIGIGTDIVAIARIESAHARFGAKFMRRIFSADEIGAGNNAARYLAMRFAAKEAAWKALPFARGQGVGWHDFTIGSDAAGAPQLHLTGMAEKIHRIMAEKHGLSDLHANLSLSDDGGFALAFVVLSAS